MNAISAAPATTREQLLTHAQTLIRLRGYNGFSYRDLADQVGVKTASIHYHFPTKDDLLLAAVDDYREKARHGLAGISDALPAKERLDRFAQMLIKSPTNQICLCGMLAADFASVSARVQEALRQFFTLVESWLGGVMEQGARDGTLKPSADPQSEGRRLFAAFQGALISSRLFQSTTRLEDVVASVQVGSDKELAKA